MACKITAVNGKSISYAQKEFLLNELADVDKLPKYGIKGSFNDSNDTVKDAPCDYGSTALVCTGGLTEVYILNADNEWTLM